MAYVPNQLPKEEENQFAPTGATTPNPIPPQTGGSAGSSSQGTGGAPGQATSTQFGSNAAKLSDYLKANEPQVGQFGQQVAGQLTDQYNKTMGNIDTGFGNFNQQVGQSYTPANQDQINQATTNPTEFAKNPENVKAFQSMYNDQYTGPQNFEGTDIYAGLNDNVNKSVENAGLTGSFSGLQTYLNNNLNTGSNSPGVQTLDTALLQRSPEASQAIQSAAAPYKNLTDYLAGKTQAGNAAVQNAKQTAQGISSGLKNQFSGEGGFIPTLQNDLTNRLNQTRQTQGTAANQAVADYQAGKATPEELKLLGFDTSDLSDKALTNSWQIINNLKNDYGADTNIDSIFTKQSPDVVYGSPGSVATPEEVARMQALGQLTGQDYSQFIGGTSPNGSVVNTNKQALGALGPNLNARDSDNILQHASQITNFSDWDGGPAPDMASFMNAIRTSAEASLSREDKMAGKQPDYQAAMDNVYDRALQSGDQTLIHALQRAGFHQSSGTGTVGTETNPGTLRASGTQTPGVY